MSSFYQGYLYAYPHKSAYRDLTPARSLTELWHGEDHDRLCLYVHVPFCGVRCAFCNLLTQVGTKGDADAPAVYVDAVLRHAAATAEALPDARYRQAAIGGGTPTYLPADQLDRLLGGIGWQAGSGPLSVEVSPDTVDAARLYVLAEHRTSRVSMGIQTFDDAEARAVGRPQRSAEVLTALEQLRGGPWELNLDLIYGIAGQTPESWLSSLEQLLAWEPAEVYLYPLYVRPLTGLGLSGRSWDDQRLALYRIGRDRLAAAGYHQLSMRSFRKRTHASPVDGTEWCCQDDGMVGLGAGARSYTTRVHWSTEYAVAQQAVRAIVAGYSGASRQDLSQARVGYDLNEDEQRRRFIIKSVLRTDGLERSLYVKRFSSDPVHDLPALIPMLEAEFLIDDGTHLRPTAAGLERSDQIGPALVSPQVLALSEEWELR
ncbi:MAG: STM4012 family radical SAM protein [Actinomycetota bacterium]|nr:STM4012 family radical SAM protein [Actinomycetota bacterium]